MSVDDPDPGLDLLSQASIETLLEQFSIAIVLAVAPSGRIMLANRAARDLFPEAAVDAASVAEYPVAFRPDGSTIDPQELPLARALRAGDVTDGDRIRFRLEDGSWRTVEVRAGPVRDAEGTVIAAISSAIDVSAQERRELADREFVANAAHQLRNPLAAIRGAVEVLQGGGKDEPETRDRFLAHIERESARLTRLARALLLLARTQAMVESPRTEIVQLAPVLEELAGRRALGDVQIEVRCPPDLAAVANAELLEEALTCLVDNAVRYGNGQPVVLESFARERSVAIEIRDRGPGIPANVQKRIYERFYRSGEGSGFGLGLSIATQAAQAMDATLEIETSAGAGTVARITIPVVRLVER